MNPNRRGSILISVLLVAFLALSFVAIPSTFGQEGTPEITPDPLSTPSATIPPDVTATPPPPVEPTEAPVVTETPAPAETIEPEETVEPTPESTPEPEATLEVTEEAPLFMPLDLVLEPLDNPVAACEMSAVQASPADPFTFNFAAVNLLDINAFAWTINGTPVSTAQSFTHVFGSTGTYAIELICTSPTVGALPPISGSVTVASIPQAEFDITPAVSGYAPLNVTTANTSTGQNLTYLWQITQKPAGAGTFPNVTTLNASYSFTVPGTYRIQLTATNTFGASIHYQDVTVLEREPHADFTLLPGSGALPLTVTINPVVFADSGPITQWVWDFNNDGTPDATDNTTGVIPPAPHTTTFTTVNTYSIRLDYSGPGGTGWVLKQVVVTPEDGDITAAFHKSSQRNVSGGIEACFTNESTGPIAHNRWNFGDGSPVVENNASVVCHVYASEGPVEVTLHAENAGGDSSGEVKHTYTIIGAPVAVITSSATTITWGSTVNLSGSSSTGEIDTYEWDFNGDGVTDATTTNVNNVPIGNYLGVMSLGANPVRLTVTGFGGTSFVELIITVNRLELTCDFTGSLAFAPGTQTFTQAVGNIGGRAVTYHWSVVGPSPSTNAVGYNTANISHNFAAEGNYSVTMTASTADGSSCSTTKTAVVTWPALTCPISGPLTPTPNGAANTYTVTVGSLAGRTAIYEWFVNGASVQTGTSTTLSRTYTTSPTNEAIYVVVTPSAGTGCTSNTLNVVAAWPVLTCNITSSTGNFTPRPNMPSDPGSINTITYTADSGTTGTGRTLTYAWTVSGTGNGANTGTAQTITRNWPWTDIGTTATFNVTITATSPSGQVETKSCTARTVTVTQPALTCGTPTGDINPVLNENALYNHAIGSLFGRTPTVLWTLEQNVSGSWVAVITNQPGVTFSYQFLLPGQTYRLRYSASATDPVQSCTSGNLTITTPVETNSNFACEGWAATSGNRNNWSPSAPGTNYTFRMVIDNTNALNLQYRWVIIEGGVERTLLTQTSTVDGNITTTNILGSALGPVGNKTLRVYVTPVNAADSTYSCQQDHALTVGTITVDFSTTPATHTLPNVQVGEQICLDNLSTTSLNVPPGTTNGLSYQWDFGTANNSLGTQTSTTAEPGCFSFTQQGTYTITLRGTNTYGDMTATKTVTVNVWNAQSILIQRTDSNMFAGQNFCFSAAGVNINTYAWTITNIATGATVGTNPTSGTTRCQLLANPGNYRVTVVGNGPLGNTTASLDVNVLPANSISAAFTPSQYAGIAPMHVCFTDNSQGGPSSPITSWDWNFGNGQTLSYTTANKPASICTDYTTQGTVYPVTLTVRNAAGQSAIATNRVRTYNLVEASSTFSINQQTATRFCFAAILAPGVTVTGWDFGDGVGTAGAVNTPCYTYTAAGTYLVTMNIPGGSIVRQVIVQPPGGTPPSLSANAVCSADRTATFTITNTGGAMMVDDVVRVTNAAGQVIYISSLKLAANTNTQFNLSNMSGPVTLTTVDTGVSVTANCNYAPAIAVSGICQSGAAAFVVNNPSSPTVGPMHAAQSYEIRNAANTVVASGTFLLLGGESTTITIPGGSDPYDTYRFVSSGYAGSFNVSQNCHVRPVLTVTSTCANPVVITVTNTGGPMVQGQAYAVTSGATTVASGTLNLATGGTETITLTGLDPYAGYTLTSTGFAGTLNHTPNCARPNLVVTSACAYPIVFTVRNTGGSMVMGQGYTVTSGGSPVTSGTLNLANGASTTITLTGLDPYAGYTFSTSGLAGNVTRNQNCAHPVLTVTSTCANPIAFTVSNTGGAMLLAQGFTIVNGSGVDVTPSPASFTIAAGGSRIISLTGLDPYAGYTFSSSGLAGTLNRTQDCTRPSLTVTSQCANPIAFTVTNNGGAMLLSQSFTVTSGGSPVLSNAVTLGAGASTTISLTGMDPYAGYLFSTSGWAGAATNARNCARPTLVVTSQCANPIEFVVQNTGGDMLLGQNYTVTTGATTSASGTLNLANGASTAITLTGLDPYAGYTFNTAGFAGTVTRAQNCQRPNLVVTSQCANPIAFTVQNTGGPMLLGQAYTITAGASTVNSGTLNLAANGTTTITLTGLDPYAGYTFNTTGFAGNVTQAQNCARPNLVVTSQCANPIAFTVQNTGGAMLLGQSYTVTTGASTVNSGTLNLAAGGSTTISLTGLDPYAGYTFNTTGFAGDRTTAQNCARPNLTVTSQCANPIAFTVTNTGGAMLLGQDFTIVNGASVDVTPAAHTLNLAAGGSTTISLTGLDPYAGYTFNTTGFAGAKTLTQNCARPNLTVTSQCANPIAFTVTNSGGAMLLGQDFTIVNGASVDVTPAAHTLNLAAGGSTTISLTGLDPYAGYTFNTTGFAGAKTLTQNCARPNLVITSQCANPIAFTVTNTGGAMLLGQDFTIVNGASVDVTPAAHTLNLAAGGTTTISLTGLDPYAGYTFNTTGFAGAKTLTQNCARPNLTVTSQCANPIAFTISNTGGAMLLGQDFTIVNGASVDVTPAAHTFTLAQNGTTTISLTGLDPYAGYTFNTSNSGFAGTVTTIQNCQRPVLVITSQCANPIAFTVTNNGGAMLLAQAFTIVNGAGTDVTPANGNLNLAAGASRTITLTGLDPYAGYTLSTAGFAGDKSLTQNCERPNLTVTSQCANPIAFTVENTGGDMLLGQDFTIVNGANVDVTPAAHTLNLAKNGTTTITLTGLDPYAGYTFSTTGFAGDKSLMQNCARPNLVITSQCANPIAFTVENTGGDMLLGQDFTIVNGANVDVTPAAHTLNLAKNASTTISLTGLDPYAGYTFNTTGFAGDKSLTQNCARPNLTVTSQCANPIAFTVTNSGGDMLLGQDFTIVNGANVDVTPGAHTLNLAKNASTTISLTGLDPYAGYTFSTAGFAGDKSLMQNCARPNLVVTSQCANPIAFTVENTGGDMLLGQDFTIVNGANVDVTPGAHTLNLAKNASTTISLTGLDPYAGYTFSTTGFAGDESLTQECERPVLVITSQCSYPIAFTVENTGGDMLAGQDFTIVNGANVDVTPAAHTLNLAKNGTTTISLTGLDPYAGYTMSTAGFASTVSTTQNCQRPDLVVTSQCVNPIAFTVTNNGGAMLTGQAYTIKTGATTVNSGTLNLGVGGTTAITLTDLDPYAGYTFNTAGFAGDKSLMQNCQRPNLVITSQCAFPIEFFVENTGGNMLLGQDFTIVNGAGVDVTPADHTFHLAANGTLTITLTGLDPYAGYTLRSSGFAGTYTMTQNCQRPNLSVDLVCGAVPHLIVRNSGGTMLLAQEFSVTQDGGRDITPAPNTLELAAGASADLELSAADAYVTYYFHTDGFAGTVNATKNCALPSLAAEATCSPVGFTVVNFGADMLVGQSYSITGSNGVDVTPAGVDLMLAAGGRTTIGVPNADPALDYTFTTTGVAGTTTVTSACAKPTGLVPTAVPGAGIPVVDGVSDLAVEPPPTCGRNCPTFRLYHTNETGNWEIFRLDSADDVNRTTQRVNLSLGEGEGIDDMAPSLSPNTEWIVFTSNRATEPNQPENWELFVAPTSGGDPDAVRRVTWNTTANDTDPVWGPNNWVAFESNRNGDWDLYAIDMSTGLEYRLTDDPADDINPFWSPDGSKLVFQSQRDGQWQIYELTLSTGSLRRLSDGTAIDVDPTYSPDGTQIAFRSYAGSSANSVIHLMSTNGTGRVAITSAEENATNQVWSPNGQLIAFQSDLDGDLDIYVYELASGATRKVTDNEIADYAPTWRCGDDIVIFTSDIEGDPNIFEEHARPITDPAVLVNPHSDQLTFEAFDDVYPQMNPSEEDASLEGQTPDGVFGEQTIFLQPVIERDTPDLSIDGIVREEWPPIDGCAPTE